MVGGTPPPLELSKKTVNFFNELLVEKLSYFTFCFILKTELENQMRALEEHHRQQIKDLEREQAQVRGQCV